MSASRKVRLRHRRCARCALWPSCWPVLPCFIEVEAAEQVSIGPRRHDLVIAGLSAAFTR
jgi:hypothetical protein